MNSPGPRNGRDALPDGVLSRFGITRVGEITGLDVIGVPVWFACRPNSRTLAVSQGKGLSAEQARMSAIMDSLEGAVAERTETLTQHVSSISDMNGRGHPLVQLKSILKCNPERLDMDRPRRWIEGRSLYDGTAVWAPLELVGLDLRHGTDFDHAAFRMDSIGLAASFCTSDSILHALLELIESDATAFFETFASSWSKASVVDLADSENEQLISLVGRLGRLGVPVTFRNLTSDIDVPALVAIIPMPPHGNSGAGVRYAAGFAARPDPEMAALAALLEALQSRLTEISGSRDDLVEEEFSDVRTTSRQPPDRQLSIGSLRHWPDLNGASSDLKLKALVSHLRSKGIGNLYVFELPSELDTLHVVRVVATDLEVGTNHGVARFGSRMLRRIYM